MNLKIVFISIEAYGHINSCIGLAKQLMNYGHDIVFILPDSWTETITGHGFAIKTVALEGSSGDSEPSSDSFMNDDAYDKEPIEKFKFFDFPVKESIVSYVDQTDSQYEKYISQIKPDLIIYDFWMTVPAIVKSGIPYVFLWSCSPTLPYWRVNGPPYSSGLGMSDGSDKIKKYRDDMNDSLKEKKTKVYELYQRKGLDIEKLTFLDFTLIVESPYLSVYSYPEDLDYSEFGPIPDKWFRLDHLVRLADPATPLGIDESLLKTNQKIILFTLGSLATANYKLISRLINFLGKSKHMFIATTGINHKKIKLPENVCGAQYLNQMAIMPRVDMVIHHGGNNSLVETLYFGKPFIVMPLFGDQHDNARRVVDKKIGKCLNPCRVTQNELLETVDEVLNDTEMQARIKTISKKLRETKTHQLFNEKIIKIVENYNKK